MNLETMIAMLTEVDINDLHWHAERYDSAAAFMALVALAYPPSNLTYKMIRDAIVNISIRCTHDGADYGNIPCLGGKAKEVWITLRERN